jgi:hypothetical protein
MRIRLTKKKFKRFSGGLIFLIVTFLIVDYLSCDIYDFQSPKEFSGAFLYNPYKRPFSDWEKANFHAHSVAWNGITNGKQPAQTILDQYKQKGYNFSCISNYESVVKEDAEPNSINVYEHGCNITKTHHLVIMPDNNKVCYQDFPLLQFASTKQFMISKLNASAKVIAMPHPVLCNGYTDEDIKKLSGYDLIEVLNHSVNSSNKWDVALSAGKPVWIIGDDDTHDISDTNQTFTNWTMINSNPYNKDSIIDNLKSGNAYAVNGKNAVNDNALLNVSVDSLSFLIQLQKNADSIKFIGQNGEVKKTIYSTDKAGYTFLNNDSYIRTVVYNKATTMYLNPLIRYNGKERPENIITASVNTDETVLYRGFLITCWLCLFSLMNPNTSKQITLEFKRRKQKVFKLPDFA